MEILFACCLPQALLFIYIFSKVIQNSFVISTIMAAEDSFTFAKIL